MLEIRFTNTNGGEKEYGLTTGMLYDRLYESLGDDLSSALLVDEDKNEITLLVGESDMTVPTIHIEVELVDEDFKNI